MLNANLPAEQRKEAVERMKALKLSRMAIIQFENNGIVYRSENGKIIPLSDEEKNMVNSWEKQTGCLVYHVIKDRVNNEDHYGFFLVSKKKNAWAVENMNIKIGKPIVYCLDLDKPIDSSYGVVSVKTSPTGGLKIVKK